MDIKIARLITENGGSLPTHSAKGGYPLYYLTKDNHVLCPKCANATIQGDYPVDHILADDIIDFQINWDNEELMCYAKHKIDTATLQLGEEKGMIIYED